ncbi:MAG TPA: IgGFc-binding protein [Kofleriaceae bacterium]|nr:IgGFc-binding protein [Kofleriaceae bacterium]
MGRSGLLCALVSGALSCGGDGGGGAGGGGDDDGGGGVCVPGATYCAGEEEDEVWECNEDGTGGRFVEACPAGLTCSRGECVTACERAARDPSNVGCEFWAVDLDNEAFDMGLGASNDAAAQQFAVAIANENDHPVEVTVWRNAARVGEPVQEEVVTTATVPPNDMVRLDLPQREVDGSMGQNGSYARNSGSGTFVSSHAYRIVADAPVVAYQFNPIVQQFSNDASVLIPVQALGYHHYVIGWPTANPCGPPPGDPLHQESVPDRTAVTVVGVEPDTEITVVPTHPIAPSGGPSGAAIPATPAGQPITLTIGTYDVVNLESDQPTVPIQECFNHLDRDGDLTGTLVTSTRPVAVFTSLERGIGFGGAQVPEPPGWDGDLCCTDHLEEQMLPTTALGWEFAVSRSPIRSTDPGWVEPDIYRVLGTVDGTEVITNLAPPYDRIRVDAGEHVTFPADRGFVARSQGGAIVLAQVLVSQRFIPQGGTGDPTLIVFPPAEQHRDRYLFLVPPTFSQNYMVLAVPDGAEVTVDGLGLDLMTGCEEGEIGERDGTHLRQVTCPVAEGVHRVAADRPLGLTVYGYYSVGSYGYPGGSDVEIINPVD